MLFCISLYSAEIKNRIKGALRPGARTGVTEPGLNSRIYNVQYVHLKCYVHVYLFIEKSQRHCSFSSCLFVAD